MKILIAAGIVLLSLPLLYLLVCVLLGLEVVRSSLMPERVPPEETRKKDIGNGCPECFEDYDSRWERHPFELECYKAVISGEYIINPESAGERRRVAIICHGHTVSRTAALKYGRMFYQLGYNLIIFDERYFGKSKARNCTLGMHESQDVKRLMAFAREKFGEDCFIALHGESMGAATVLLTLAIERPELVVADCPFARPYTLMTYLTKKRISFIPAAHILGMARVFGRAIFGYDMKAVNPVEAVEQSDVPICLIHGLCDTYVPCEHSSILYEACRNPESELHMVPGAGHARSYAIDLAGYEKIIGDFVRKVEAERY